jgi:hypothetical protein
LANLWHRPSECWINSALDFFILKREASRPAARPFRSRLLPKAA